MVWYSHLLKNFPFYCDPHKGFGIVNKAEIDVFLEVWVFDDPAGVGSLISGSSALSCACSVVFSATDPALGHHRPTPPPETPGHLQASLGPSPAGSVLLSPGSWCAQVLFVPSKSLFP